MNKQTVEQIVAKIRETYWYVLDQRNVPQLDINEAAALITAHVADELAAPQSELADLKNANGLPFIRSEAIRNLKADLCQWKAIAQKRDDELAAKDKLIAEAIDDAAEEREGHKAAEAEAAELERALRSSCDDERSLAVSEGISHGTCGLVSELTATIEKQADEIARLQTVISAVRAINRDEFGQIADYGIGQAIAPKADAKGEMS